MRLWYACTFGVLLFVPALAAAQGTPLVPDCEGGGCGIGELVLLVENVIDFVIVLATIIVTLLFVYAGFLLVFDRGSHQNRTRATNIIWAGVVGLIITLASWLIINTVLSLLTGKGLEFWSGFQFTSSQESHQQTHTAARQGTGSDVVVGGNKGTFEHESFAAQLGVAGVAISSSGGCADRNRPTCTSLDGMRRETVDHVVALRQECNCAVTVTGGTEVGHAAGTYSHANGYKVDLALNAGLNAYIEQNAERSGSRNGDHRYCMGGNEYVRESNHWDVTVGAGC